MGLSNSNHDRRTALESLQATMEKCGIDQAEFISTLLYHSNCLIICLDDRAHIVAFNAECERITGYKADEVIGKSWPELFLPRTRRQPEDFVSWVRAHPSDSYEGPILTKDGQERIILWSNTALIPPMPRRQLLAIAIGIDITHWRAIEHNLRESEGKYRLIVDNVQLAISLLNFEGEILFINNCGAAMLRSNAADLIGKTQWDLFPREIADQQADNIRTVIATRKGMFMESRSIIAGQERWFNVIIQPCKDAGSATGTALVIALDITDRKLAELEILRTQEQLEQRVKNRTHELARANEDLRLERQALVQKNIAMQELLNQIESGKKELSYQMQANINRVILPLLDSLETKISADQKGYFNLLKSTLADISSPFMRTLEVKYARLTPRELEICQMIRGGMRSKEIAASLNISVQTVLKQRAQIRKKLGVAGEKINLVSHLKSMDYGKE